MTIGTAYTYKALSFYFRTSGVEIIMFMGAQHSWCRQVAVAAAALAMLGLCIGTFAQSATAQVYPGYSSGSQAYPGYSPAAVPPQGAPGYSSPAPYSWGGGGNPGWVWYPGWGWWSPSWGWSNPGWGWAGWGWPGWGWGGWGWPVGISVGWGWGGWWGGRGCWNCGFRGGFHGGGGGHR